jgi:outer membrane protein OmpA-like peptidoglycan-associated protein
MKKAFLLVFLASVAGSLLLPAQEQQVLNIQKAYVYQEAVLLISETDLNCTFFINKEGVTDKIRIIGTTQMDVGRLDYADGDQVFINQGGLDGRKEGEMFIVIGEGKTIRHPLKGGSLGRYYLKEALGQITCLYDHRAVLTLNKGCNPVRVGDIVLPFTPEPTVFKKKFIYTLCRIPTGLPVGNIVYNDLYINDSKELGGDSHYIAVDLGSDRLQRGSFVLFYRVLKSKLPPVINGLGIVIHTETTNSTVKILDAANEIRVGDFAVSLPEPQEAVAEIKPKPEDTKENIPIVDALAKEGGKKEESLMIEMYFDFDSKTVGASYAGDFEKIAGFIRGKSEYAIVLRGYTCSIGGEEYNLKLSQERVEAVKSVLVSQFQIDAGHIETFYYGEKQDPYDNSSEVERRKNRLVRIEVVGK